MLPQINEYVYHKLQLDIHDILIVRDSDIFLKTALQNQDLFIFLIVQLFRQHAPSVDRQRACMQPYND